MAGCQDKEALTIIVDGKQTRLPVNEALMGLARSAIRDHMRVHGLQFRANLDFKDDLEDKVILKQADGDATERAILPMDIARYFDPITATLLQKYQLLLSILGIGTTEVDVLAHLGYENCDQLTADLHDWREAMKLLEDAVMPPRIVQNGRLVVSPATTSSHHAFLDHLVDLQTSTDCT